MVSSSLSENEVHKEIFNLLVARMRTVLEHLTYLQSSDPSEETQARIAVLIQEMDVMVGKMEMVKATLDIRE